MKWLFVVRLEFLSYVLKYETLMEAIKMTKYMNENFCQKHDFVFIENGSEL